MANEMTDLINRIELVLATDEMNLPEHLAKDKWVSKVITPLTLKIFSRYFPNKARIFLDESMKKNGWYLIDKELFGNANIIGVRDIGWDQFSERSSYFQSACGYGTYDSSLSTYNVEDIGLMQARADQASLFNNGIYVEFQPPNKLRLKTSVNSNLSTIFSRIPIDVLIEHSPNLMTIEPTKMNIFEDLAISDVATFLYERLKYYDQIDTVYATVDLKLQTLEEWKNRRPEFIQRLEDSYVSPSNTNQPMIFSI